MPKFNVTSPSGEKFVITAPDGATEEEVLAKAQEYFAEQAKTAQKESSFLSNASVFLQTNPVSKAARGAMKPFVGLAQKAANLTPWGDDVNRFISEEERGQQGLRSQANFLGLPAGTLGVGPQEGIDLPDAVGQGMTYAAGLRGLSPFKAPGVMGRAGNAAVQGGAAGFSMPVTNAENLTLNDLATGRQKDSLWGQAAKNVVLGAGVGGAASPLLDLGIAGVAGGVNAIGRTAKTVANSLTPPTNVMVNLQVVRQLEQRGIDWRALSDDVKKAILKEANAAMKVGGKLDVDSLARLADYKQLGITPMRSWVTRDPAQFTNEANLAKVQANTGGGKLVDAQVLGNAKLTQTLDSLGAAKAGGRYAAGEGNIALIQAADNAKASAVDGAYTLARSLNGGDIKLDARKGLSDLVARLEADGSLPYLGSFGGVVNKIIGGEMPLTVGTAQGLLKTISRASKSPDGNVKHAMSELRKVIENADPAEQLGADAMKAFASARKLAKARFDWQDSAPAIRAALDDAAPDKFFDRFILNGNVRDIAEAAKVMTPQMKQENRALIAQHLRDRAAKGAAQGDANALFNQNQYNDALRAIGKEKLALFFTRDEVQKLQMIGRAAYNMKAQPVGSAVNNSNTAASAFKLLDSFVSKIPFGKSAAGDMFSNLAASRLEAQAMRPQVFAPYQPLKPEQIRGLLGGPALPVAAVGLLGS